MFSGCFAAQISQPILFRLHKCDLMTSQREIINSSFKCFSFAFIESQFHLIKFNNQFTSHPLLLRLGNYLEWLICFWCTKRSLKPFVLMNSTKTDGAKKNCNNLFEWSLQSSMLKILHILNLVRLMSVNVIDSIVRFRWTSDEMKENQKQTL